MCGFTPRITRFVDKFRWKHCKKKKAKGLSTPKSYKMLDEGTGSPDLKPLDEMDNDTYDDGDSGGAAAAGTTSADIPLKGVSSSEDDNDSYEEEDDDYTSGSNNSGHASSDSGLSCQSPGLVSVNIGEGESAISGYLYKKSKWHSKAKVHRLKWRRKWYVLKDDAFFSCKDPLLPEVNRHEIPLAEICAVERDRAAPRVFVVKMTGSKKYTFRAQTKEVAGEWMAHIREAAEAVAARKANEIVTPTASPKNSEADSGVNGSHKSYWDIPEDKLWKKIMWGLATPYYALFTITIPNVKKKRFENWFILTFVICLGWIAALSYGMVWCAERFAIVFHIPEDIMGLTITAIGASLPSFFGSVIAARDGSCHMAVSNTFGANLSSILVALGLPCFIQTAFITPGKSFAMESESIVITVIVLVAGLVIFLISIGVTRLWLNKPLGVLYFALYVILLGIVVAFQILGIYF